MFSSNDRPIPVAVCNFFLFSCVLFLIYMIMHFPERVIMFYKQAWLFHLPKKKHNNHKKNLILNEYYHASDANRWHYRKWQRRLWNCAVISIEYLPCMNDIQSIYFGTLNVFGTQIIRRPVKSKHLAVAIDLLWILLNFHHWYMNILQQSIILSQPEIPH